MLFGLPLKCVSVIVFKIQDGRRYQGNKKSNVQTILRFNVQRELMRLFEGDIKVIFQIQHIVKYPRNI